MADKHKGKVNLAKLHKQGACLTRHQKREEGNLCSHQWQARVQAEAHPKVYNHPAYHKLCGEGFFRTAARIARSGKLFPRNYASPLPGRRGFWKEQPTCEGKEWNLGRGQNFNDYREPYWHNAHHIIPNGALKASISDAAKADARLDNLIKAGLLEAEYNLNDKDNMVIVPMEQIVAAAMKLPRHLLGDQVGPDEKKEMRSHEDYSKKVEKRLKSIMKSYKSALAKGRHPEKVGPISKARLVKLSKTLYKEIIAGGKANPGAALSQLDL